MEDLVAFAIKLQLFTWRRQGSDIINSLLKSLVASTKIGSANTITIMNLITNLVVFSAGLVHITSNGPQAVAEIIRSHKILCSKGKMLQFLAK